MLCLKKIKQLLNDLRGDVTYNKTNSTYYVAKQGMIMYSRLQSLFSKGRTIKFKYFHFIYILYKTKRVTCACSYACSIFPRKWIHEF